MFCPWKLLDEQSNSLGDFIESPQFSQILNWMILDNSLWKFESTDVQIFLQIIIHTFPDIVLLGKIPLINVEGLSFPLLCLTIMHNIIQYYKSLEVLYWFWFCFEKGSHCLAQVGLELEILLLWTRLCCSSLSIASIIACATLPSLWPVLDLMICHWTLRCYAVF